MGEELLSSSSSSLRVSTLGALTLSEWWEHWDTGAKKEDCPSQDVEVQHWEVSPRDPWLGSAVLRKSCFSGANSLEQSDDKFSWERFGH